MNPLHLDISLRLRVSSRSSESRVFTIKKRPYKVCMIVEKNLDCQKPYHTADPAII